MDVEPLPPLVEEGLCELVAWLFLSRRARERALELEAARAAAAASSDARDADEAEADADVEAVRAMLAADERLCRCFAHSIEHARDAVGDAFRKAVRGHAALGLTELISYARAHGDFPGLP